MGTAFSTTGPLVLGFPGADFVPWVRRPLQPCYCILSLSFKYIFCRKAGEDLLGDTTYVVGKDLVVADIP